MCCAWTVIWHSNPQNSCLFSFWQSGADDNRREWPYNNRFQQLYAVKIVHSSSIRCTVRVVGRGEVYGLHAESILVLIVKERLGQPVEACFIDVAQGANRMLYLIYHVLNIFLQRMVKFQRVNRYGLYNVMRRRWCLSEDSALRHSFQRRRYFKKDGMYSTMRIIEVEASENWKMWKPLRTCLETSGMIRRGGRCKDIMRRRA